MDLVREDIAGADTDGALASLGNLAKDNTEVGDGVADGLLKLSEVTSRILDTLQGNEQPQDVVSSLENSEDSEIPHNLLEAECPHVAVATENLNCLVSDEPGGLGGEDLGDGGLELIIIIASIHSASHHVGHGFSGVVNHGHLGKLLLDGAIAVNPGAELDPVGSVIRGLLDDGPHGSREGGAHPKPAVVEDLHSDLESITWLAENILHGDGSILEVDLGGVAALDPHLLLRGSIGDTPKRSLDNEGGDLLSCGAGSRVSDGGLGEHGEDLSNSSIGDPDLATIEDPVGALLIELGPGLDGAGIRARAWLGQSKGGEILPRGELRKVFLLLSVSAGQQNALEADGLVSSDENSHTKIIPSDDLCEPGVLGVGKAHAVQLNGNL